MRTSPGTGAGCSVRPASEVVTARRPAKRSSVSPASAAASAVPPRMSKWRRLSCAVIDPGKSDIAALSMRRRGIKAHLREELAAPVDQHDVDAGRAGERGQRHLAGPPRHHFGQGWFRVAGDIEERAGALRLPRRCDRIARAAELAEKIGERCYVDLAFGGVEIEMAGGKLRHLAEAAGERQPLDRMAAQIFERAADEIAHIDERDLGKTEAALNRGLRGRTGAGGEMGKTR